MFNKFKQGIIAQGSQSKVITYQLPLSESLLLVHQIFVVNILDNT